MAAVILSRPQCVNGRDAGNRTNRIWCYMVGKWGFAMKTFAVIKWIVSYSSGEKLFTRFQNGFILGNGVFFFKIDIWHIINIYETYNVSNIPFSMITLISLGQTNSILSHKLFCYCYKTISLDSQYFVKKNNLRGTSSSSTMLITSVFSCDVFTHIHQSCQWMILKGKGKISQYYYLITTKYNKARLHISWDVYSE